jgi:uncharacterized membrane protein (UPF0182 family)
MPQLKKVALAIGNTLAYADTYEQALTQLTGAELPPPQQPTPAPAQGTPTPGTKPATDDRITEVRRHLQRYRELVSQGKLSEAGKELEAIQALVER